MAGGTIRVQIPHSKVSSSSTGAPARDPLACARAFRSDGNGSWSDGDIKNAVSFWERALSAVEDVRGRVPEKEIEELEKPVLTNLSQGLIRLNRFSEAKTRAVEASQIDVTCIKAQYRLAEACVGLGEWKEAEELFAKLDAAGHAAIAANGRRHLRIKQQEARQVEREFAARMFAGGDKIEETVLMESGDVSSASAIVESIDPSDGEPSQTWNDLASMD